MSKRIIAAVLTLVMLFGMFPTTAFATESPADTVQITQTPVTAETQEEKTTEPAEETVSDEPIEVTRAQWLQMLAEAFSMTVEDEVYPDNYFLDLDSSSEYYYDMLLAVEFGVVDIPAGGNLYPDEAATREFAVTTMNFCLGFQPNPEITLTFSEANEVTNPYDIQIAIDRGWFALVDGAFLPEQPITQAEANTMTADAVEVLAAAVIDENYESVYRYTADVIEVPDGTKVEATDTGIVIYNNPVKLAAGDIFVVYFEGIPCIYLAETVNYTGIQTILTVSTVDESQYYETMEAQGSVDAKFTDFVPEDGTEIIYIDEDTGEEYLDPFVAEQAMAMRVQNVSPNASGTVTLNRTIKVKQSLGKYGASGYIEVEIKNPKIKYDISLSKKKVAIELNGDTDINYGVEADLMEALDLDEIKIGFIGVNGIGGITISVALEAKAALYGSVSGKLTKGLSFSDGEFRLIKKFQKNSFSLVAEFSGKVGVVVKLGITDIPADALEGYIYAEIGAQGKVTHKKYSEATCTHVAFYMYFEAGFKASVKLGFYKKSWEYTADIWDDSNSPIRSVHHYDNGVLVPGCTLGNSGSDNNNGYYTPTESPYWGSNWSGGDNSTGYNSAGEPVVTYGYSLDDDGNATITSYTGTATSLTIPKTIDGYPIVAIGPNVFKNRTGIHTVIMQDNILTIGSNAFQNCTNLAQVQLSPALTRIDDWAFNNCTSLTQIRFPDTVTRIGAASFGNCTSLASVTLSKGLTEICAHAFYNCDALTAIEIPKSLETTYNSYISAYAYGYVYGPFYGCDNLKEITFEEGTYCIANGLFANCPGIEAIVIPDTVTVIESNAFQNCTNLAQVQLSSALTRIDDWAFNNCTSLTQIRFPDTVTRIGAASFGNCTSLASVTLSKGLTEICAHAFYNCDALTAIEIPKSLETTYDSYISAYAYGYVYGTFYGCDNLKEITFEEGTYCIANGLFANCPGIEAIVIPDTVTVIESNAFQNCTNLAQVQLSSALTQIDGWAFNNCTALTQVQIPDTVTSIGSAAFGNCTSLASVTLSKKLKTITAHAFYNCDALTSIEIPKSLETTYDSYISAYAYGYVYGPFYGCDGLKTATFEEGTTIIARGLFANCHGLESIQIPDTVTNIDYQAFLNCTALKEIVVPESVTTISTNVFNGATALTTVTWPSSLTAIPEYTFCGCIALATVNLPENLKTINRYAFYNCDALVTFTMPDSVTTVNENVFYGCSALTEIHLSDSLQKINNNTFYDCDALTSITIPCGVTSIGNSAFYDCDALESVDMANSVTSLGTNVFYHNDVLKNVTLSRNLTAIPTGTFKECALLEEIVIPYFTTSIGDNAFNSSPKLTKVVTHDKLTSISSTAFSYADRTVFYGPAGSYTETWCGNNGYTFAENTSAATSVTLSETAVSIPKGKTYTLDMTIAPADFADTITFKSGNTAVATVDETGKITAVATGTATIKVIVGDASASCKVTVTQGITKITLNRTTLALDVPDTYQLTAAITPTDATNQVLEWTSSNTAAATVDANGLVTAVGNGTAVITATATDGTGISASCTVTVTDPTNIPVSGIQLDKATLSLEALETYQLTATITPDNAANKNLVWTSSDESVATVDENGLVTALAKGTAAITAAATDEGGVSASCTVTVTNTAHIVTDVSSLESSHNYPNRCSDFWVYTAAGADTLSVTFDARTEMEDGFDYLHIYDGEGNLIGTYTGTELAGQTVEVPGDTVKIQIVSDDSGTEWGFKVTEVKARKQTETIATGWTGVNQWTLTDDGVLTVYGSGAMKNYGYGGGQPWLNKGVDIVAVVIEEGVTAVGSGAFMNLTTLETVSLPESLTKMGEAAFYGTGLTSVEIPASLWTIQPYTFKNCTALASVTFHEGNLMKISDGAFYGTALTELVLPDCLDILDVYAFKGCSKLESITIGSGLTEIREAVFYGTAIPTITIPEGITKIGPYAFKNCVELETVELPESLTSVGEASFYACTALKGVDLPDKVTTIGNYAFRKCAAMTSLNFGSELVTIGECSFYGCTGLTELVIPDKVTTIKPYAFKTCTGLTSVTLGSKVATIGEGAFNTCTGLKTIVFPASLTSIGDYCFSGSYSLWKLTFEGDAPTIGTGAFKGLSATAYYPGDNATWTSSVMQNYGGTITWKVT